MSLVRHVTADELEPAGWICEACRTPFEEGDEVFGTPLSIGTFHGQLCTFEGAYRCAACFHLDAPTAR
jgi:hypothetical protein